MLFKVDFEKAYGKIKWPFVYQMLKLKEFPNAWGDIMSIIRGGSVCIRVNDKLGPYFQTYKGLRQGDSISPLLFDLAADALARIMENAKQSGVVKGMLSEEVENGINILQYADDTTFLLPDDVESAKNFLLCAFEQMSGLKINFLKNELYLFGEAKERSEEYRMIFTCKIGNLTMRYLGLPVNKVRLRNKDWNFVENKIAARCSGWQRNLLNIGARVTLVQSSLTNVPLFMPSFNRVPVGVRKGVDFFRSRMV
jgi:hypothetical protein